MEIPEPLSAKFEGSFAYFTVKDRLPVIIAKAVDTLHRNKEIIIEKYGQNSKEELKDVIGRLSKLRNELQTDKPFLEITDSLSDSSIWNEYLKEFVGAGMTPSWFKSAWLYAETYMYRRIQEAVELSPSMKLYDPFQIQKEESFSSSIDAINIVANYLLNLSQLNSEENCQFKEFMQIIQLDLWGNKCDLSISAGQQNSQMANPLTQLSVLQPNILVDDTKAIWDYLRDIKCVHKVKISIVLDNAGFELFTDLCLADYLIESRLANRVDFYVKVMPWFVSDTTRHDFNWLIDGLVWETGHPTLVKLGEKWRQYLNEGKWTVRESNFWTLPFDFSQMKERDRDLHRELEKSNLVIFKGDLNYRKLCGDLKWDGTETFENALRGFHPAPLCSLRTMKADLIVGLSNDVIRAKNQREANWMISGEYAVIQFYNKKTKL